MVNTVHRSRVVLITALKEEEWLERWSECLQSLSPDLRIERRPAGSIAALPDALWQEVEILFCSFATPLPLPEQAPRLRWVQLYSAGPAPVLDHPLMRTPVIFTTTSGIHAISLDNERAALLFEANLRRYLNNEPLHNVVDKTQGY